MRESSNEGSRCAVRVELSVDGSGREDSHLILAESVIHVSGSVLCGDRSEESAFDDKVELSSTRMDVRSVEATWAEETDGYSSALTEESWHGSAIGTNDLSTVAHCSGALAVARVLEVEDEIGVAEELLAKNGIGGRGELLEELGVFGGWLGCARCGCGCCG